MIKREKTILNNINSLERNIKNLISIKNKLNTCHEILFLLLKILHSQLEDVNITKNHFTKINNKITETDNLINLSFECISSVETLLSASKDILFNFKNSIVDNVEFKKYMNLKQKLLTVITENYILIKNHIKDNKTILLNSHSSTNDFNKKNVNPKSVSFDNNKTFLENTLLISEKRNKVILPYTLSEIKDYMSKHPNQHLNENEIIDKLYTVPLNSYRNTVLSRFAESFKLIRNKEKGSLKDALDLAFEMAFNYALHPAIITACDNVHELDIYLACLEYNELEDFKFFDINFEISPIPSKKNKQEK